MKVESSQRVILLTLQLNSLEITQLLNEIDKVKLSDTPVLVELFSILETLWTELK